MRLLITFLFFLICCKVFTQTKSIALGHETIELKKVCIKTKTDEKNNEGRKTIFYDCNNKISIRRFVTICTKIQDPELRPLLTKYTHQKKATRIFLGLGIAGSLSTIGFMAASITYDFQHFNPFGYYSETEKKHRNKLYNGVKISFISASVCFVTSIIINFEKNRLVKNELAEKYNNLKIFKDSLP